MGGTEAGEDREEEEGNGRASFISVRGNVCLIPRGNEGGDEDEGTESADADVAEQVEDSEEEFRAGGTEAGDKDEKPADKDGDGEEEGEVGGRRREDGAGRKTDGDARLEDKAVEARLPM